MCRGAQIKPCRLQKHGAALLILLCRQALPPATHPSPHVTSLTFCLPLRLRKISPHPTPAQLGTHTPSLPSVKMATVKRGDILHKNTSRGRPPKPDKERKQKQRQAYQWRDARRVYLAGSFERWRKLRGRLQLKDSSLAWHLLETHDKGCDRCR